VKANQRFDIMYCSATYYASTLLRSCPKLLCNGCL